MPSEVLVQTRLRFSWVSDFEVHMRDSGITIAFVWWRCCWWTRAGVINDECPAMAFDIFQYRDHLIKVLAATLYQNERVMIKQRKSFRR